eukprot:gene45149-biopygen36436
MVGLALDGHLKPPPRPIPAQSAIRTTHYQAVGYSNSSAPSSASPVTVQSAIRTIHYQAV